MQIPTVKLKSHAITDIIVRDAIYLSSVSRPHALAWGCRHRKTT